MEISSYISYIAHYITNLSKKFPNGIPPGKKHMQLKKLSSSRISVEPYLIYFPKIGFHQSVKVRSQCWAVSPVWHNSNGRAIWLDFFDCLNFWSLLTLLYKYKACIIWDFKRDEEFCHDGNQYICITTKFVHYFTFSAMKVKSNSLFRFERRTFGDHYFRDFLQKL